MLFARASERERRTEALELERLTLAVTNGIAITFDDKARASFERKRARRAAGVRSVREHTATLNRLAQMFPDNVKVN